MKSLTRKNSLIVLSLLVLALIFLPTIASANLFDAIPSVSDLVTGIFRIVAFIFNFIAGILLAIAGFLADLMLKLNLEVLSDTNTLVHLGWRIVRDLANLGFVLVIIIIAFATILRFEQYGVTKLLPKLIAAAIIVNFSFAIAAAFINFSHVLTEFFFSKVPGAGGGISVHLADAFGPQRLLIGSEEVPPPQLADETGGLTGLSTSVLVSITGLIFTVIFTLVAAFTIIALAFMLLLRYLYLTFLVILAPIIWLFWVVPALAGQFNKWWDKFLQWVFFAPAASFFIYLALVSAEGLSRSALEFSPGGFFGVGSILKNTVIQGAQMVVLAGILIGGLIISQKMGIIGAAGAMGMATTVGKGARAWAGRYALRAGTALPRSGIGRRITESLQRGEGGPLNISKGLSYLGGRRLGNALSTAGVVQGENLIKDAEERQKSLSDDQLALRVATMNNFDRVAALTRLAKGKKLNKIPNVAQYISDPGMKAVFESYGKKDDYGSLEKTFGANTAMLTAKDDNERNAEAEKFYASFSKADFNKIQYDEIYSAESKFGLSDTDHKLLQEAIAYGITVNNPGDVRKIMANVKSANLESADRSINEAAVDIWGGTGRNGQGDPDLAQRVIDNRKDTLEKRGKGELFDFAPPNFGSPSGQATPTP